MIMTMTMTTTRALKYYNDITIVTILTDVKTNESTISKID